MNTRFFGNSVLAICAVFGLTVALDSGFSSAGDRMVANQESASAAIQVAPDYQVPVSGMAAAEYYSASGEGRFTASGDLVGQ